MRHLLLAAVTIGLAGASATFAADEASLTFGGDQFSAGRVANVASPVASDAFVAGYDVSLGAPVTGDAHLAGYSVSVDAQVTGDLYAAGFSISVAGTVGGDVTAMGNSVAIRAPATIGGNARLLGQTVTLASPVSGSALITAQTLVIDAPISGDLAFYGEAVMFAAGAKVDGTISIHAPQQIPVPASVASADRVIFTQFTSPDYMSEAGRTAAEGVTRGLWAAVWGAVVWWVLMLAVGAVFIALLPRAVAAMEVVSQKRPFRNIGFGIIGFAAAVGLVPVLAITLLGLVLVPFAIVFVLIACSLAYVTGVYFAGLRITSTFVGVDSIAKRLLVLAGSLIAGTLLGGIPFLGWLFTLGVLTFGFGVITVVLMVRWTAKDAIRLQSASAAPVGATPSIS